MTLSEWKQGVLLGILQIWKPKILDPVWGDISECRRPALQCVAQRRRFWGYTWDKGPHWALLMGLPQQWVTARLWTPAPDEEPWLGSGGPALLMGLPQQRVTARLWMSTFIKSHGWILGAHMCRGTSSQLCFGDPWNVCSLFPSSGERSETCWVLIPFSCEDIKISWKGLRLFIPYITGLITIMYKEPLAHGETPAADWK